MIIWNEVNTNEDVLYLMHIMDNFHDSCIKEIKYYSGAYVTDALSMHPINDSRSLKVVVQRQASSPSMIEMEFSNLKHLVLNPLDVKYTCEISHAKFLYQDGYICWADNEGLINNDVKNDSGVLICASNLRWRIVEGHMGAGEFYRCPDDVYEKPNP